MKISKSFLSAVIVFLTGALLLVGCKCSPETDAQLCEASIEQCGWLSVGDRCGRARTVDCGGCEGELPCLGNACVCEPEDDVALCNRLGVECGAVTTTDRCGAERDVDCGVCQVPCDPDSNVSLCEVYDLACGFAVIDDSCGDRWEVDCGACVEPEQCHEHRCVCEPESTAVLCAALNVACGPFEATDRCGQVRALNCGPCLSGDSVLGSVRDAVSGELLDDATMRFFIWPPPEGLHWSWPWRLNHRAESPDHMLRTGASSMTGINYELTDDAGNCLPEAASGALLARQWYRIRIERTGYHPGIFYRFHEHFRADDCPRGCSTGPQGRCHRQDFELWPYEAVYPRYPELMVDIRDLDDHEWQCAHLPPGSPNERLIGLRVSVAAVNIGQGGMHLKSLNSQGQGATGVVYQHIDWSDGREDIRQLESGTFVYYEPHRHNHLMNWMSMSLVRATVECEDPSDRAPECVEQLVLKVSFCLMDLMSFDEEIRDVYDGVRNYPNPPTCNSFEQGLTQGWKDGYIKDLPGQAVILGPPREAALAGPRRVEIELDPDHMLVVATRARGVSRIPIQPPQDLDALCEDPQSVLDCSGPRQEWATVQAWQCPAYLEYAGYQ